MPYQFFDRMQLILTKEVDCDAWDITQQKDVNYHSPGDLPVAAWLADVDQPALEIVELGNRMASEFQELEVAAYRRHGASMEEVLGRIRLQMRAIERLVQLQRDAVASAA